ncbi:MAG: hypothetical protein HYZ42_01525 [Bacteroidetes bacterium]|nr:hypothetical protein [Bacteroidota bacterium]
MAKEKARQYKHTTIRRLDKLSGNECADPTCIKKLIAEDGQSIISKICHIEAASKNGPRWNGNMTDDERRDFSNLILLCDEHHTIIDNKDNELKFPVSLLKKWKTEHEAKILRLISGNNILVKNPSALNVVIGFVGKQIFGDNNTTEPTNAPDTEEKILYNNVILFKPIIEEYAVYQGKLNKLYEEIEKQGSTKKEFVLQNIKSIYLKEKGKFKDIDEIRVNADTIIESVENELWEIIDNSSNPNLDLPIEAIKISLLIVMVDAFMRCNILEEPPKL